MIFFRLLLLFTVIPLTELWLLLQFAELTSVAWTIVVVIATGLIGAALARRQGWQTWLTIQRQLAEGVAPTEALLDGLMILIAGAVLITPGLLTDLLGFALLIPPIRSVIRRRFARWFKQQSSVHVHTSGWGDFEHPATERGGDVIDAQFTRQSVDEDRDDAKR